jgi:hypothetical protein
MADPATPAPAATPATPAAETSAKAFTNPWHRPAKAAESAVDAKAPAPAAAPAKAATAPAAKPAPKASAPVAKAAAKVAAKATPAAPSAPLADPKYAALEQTVRQQREALSGFASQALADVPEAVRAAVKALAGNDPTKQLSALATLKANGLVAGALPVGATTGAASPPPAPTPKVADNDAAIAAEYERLLRGGAHIHASVFYAKNRAVIERAKSANN